VDYLKSISLAVSLELWTVISGISGFED